MDGRTKVFISYRRHDDVYVVGAVRAALVRRLGVASVFVDEGSIPAGVAFVDYIGDALRTTDVMLALIGPRWDASRLRDPGDFVHLELTAANNAGVGVMPVLHGGRRMPQRADVPDDVRWLVERNAFTIRAALDYQDDIDRLAQHVACGAWQRGGARRAAAPPTMRRANLNHFSETTTAKTLRDALRRVRGGEPS